jgi:hypothetical protein
VDEALAIAMQIAAALEAAPRARHRPPRLQAANVKVRADGTVKVLDFGSGRGAADRHRAELGWRS